MQDRTRLEDVGRKQRPKAHKLIVGSITKNIAAACLGGPAVNPADSTANSNHFSSIVFGVPRAFDSCRPDTLGGGIGQIPESSFQSRRAEAKHKPASGMLIKITATPATYPSAAAALPPPMPTTVTTNPQNM